MGGEPVIPLSLARIAQITGGQLRHGDPAAVVSGEVVIDSRRAGPGGLFAAVAPAATAAAAKSCPSDRSPATAANSPPAATRLESITTSPLTTASGSPRS